jgi:hypothetical protein
VEENYWLKKSRGFAAWKKGVKDLRLVRITDNECNAGKPRDLPGALGIASGDDDFGEGIGGMDLRMASRACIGGGGNGAGIQHNEFRSS